MKRMTNPVETIKLHLEPEEQVQRIFLARGLRALSQLLFGGILLLFAPRRMVVITNRNISVFRHNGSARDQSQLLTRLPYRASLVSVHDNKSWIRVGSENLWLYKKVYDQPPTANNLSVERSPDNWAPQVGNRRPRLAASILAILAVPIGFFGLWDLHSALTLEYRLLGFVFAVVAVAMLTGTYCLLREDLRVPWGSTVGLSGGVAGIGVGIYLSVSQFGHPHQERLIIWGLIIALSILSISLVLSQGRDSTNYRNLASLTTGSQKSDQKWSIFAKALASLGISAGLIWGVIQFWYSNQYVPSTLGTALVISPSLREIGRLEGLQTLTAEVTLKNTSSTRIRALTSLYKVEGLRGMEPVRSEASFFSRLDPAKGDRRVSRFGQENTVDVVQFGKLLDDNWNFEPGEELKTQFLIYAPHDKYVSLRLTADIIMAKGSRLVPEDEPNDSFTLRITPDAVHPYDLQFSILEWPLKQISNIRGLTKGRHAVDIVVYHVGRSVDSTVNLPGLPTMEVCIDQVNRDLRAIAKADPKAICQVKDTYRRELQEFYGMVKTSAVYEIPLQKG